jgi:hypothetical protein
VDNLRWIDVSVVPPPFVLSASTTGGGAGDLVANINGIPPGSTDVWTLISNTAAPVGPGSGPLLGLVLDSVLLSTLLVPSLPLNPLHFPVTANPFSAGALTAPAGTFGAFSGSRWEMRSIAYTAGGGPTGLTPIVQVIW